MHILNLMLKRKIFDKLVEWQNSDYHECLLIKGARQVGKTYIINEFLKESHSNFIKIDFSIDTEMLGVFDDSLNVDRIISEIAIRAPNFKPVPYETILFFDEIQLCKKARSALKSFAVDGRYRVIASGSLLGLNYKKSQDKNDVTILPMGYERIIEMRSLDFEEFLWAIGIDQTAIDRIRECIRTRTPLSESTVKTIDRYFNIYTVVGGMPEVVNRYVETKDIQAVREVQKKIISGYREDVKKYAEPSDQGKIASSFDSIPVQLSQENKKFRYSMIDSNYVPTYNTYESGITWMSDAAVIERSFNVSSPANPLAQFVKKSQFKVYLCDTGLLVCMLGLDVAHAVIADDKRVNKGAVAENIVAQCISSCGQPLYYFSNSSLEIDFITTMRGTVTAIEVKSGNNTKAKSLKSLAENYNVKRRMKFEKTDICVTEDGVEHYPIFASAFIDSMFREFDIDLSI